MAMSSHLMVVACTITPSLSRSPTARGNTGSHTYILLKGIIEKAKIYIKKFYQMGSHLQGITPIVALLVRKPLIPVFLVLWSRGILPHSASFVSATGRALPYVDLIPMGPYWFSLGHDYPHDGLSAH